MNISTANTIAETIAGRLQAIHKTNGYHTDIGRAVYRGKGQRTAANCCTLHEREEDAGHPTGRAEPYTTTAVQHFVVEAVVDCDPDNPDEAGHKAAAVVVAVMLDYTYQLQPTN